MGWLAQEDVDPDTAIPGDSNLTDARQTDSAIPARLDYRSEQRGDAPLDLAHHDSPRLATSKTLGGATTAALYHESMLALAQSLDTEALQSPARGRR